MKNSGENAITTVLPKVLKSPAMKIFLQTGFSFNSPSYAMKAPGPSYLGFFTFIEISFSKMTLSISA
jgi:hypothetical protein